MRFSAVIFDCEGTLVATEACWTRAERTLFAAHGQQFSLRYKGLLTGAALPETGRILAQILNLPGHEEQLGDELFSLACSEIARGVGAMTGALGLVDDLT